MHNASPTLRTYKQLTFKQQQQAQQLTDHNNKVLRAFLGSNAPQYRPEAVAYYVSPMGHLDGRILPLYKPR